MGVSRSKRLKLDRLRGRGEFDARSPVYSNLRVVACVPHRRSNFAANLSSRRQLLNLLEDRANARKCQTATATPAEPGDLPWQVSSYAFQVHGEENFLYTLGAMDQQGQWLICKRGRPEMKRRCAWASALNFLEPPARIELATC